MYEFERDDAYRFARHVYTEHKERNGELHFKECPYCKGGSGRKKDNYTFAINLGNGKCKCMRASCGISGNMVTLAKDFNFDLGDANEYYNPKKQYRRLPTPKESIKPKTPAVKYLASRGISEAVAEQYEITTQTKDDNILVFPFYDERGALQFIKYRKTNFDKAVDNNKEWCEANCKPILFGMKQCDPTVSTLIVTEGQIDSLTVAECGYKNAVSVPTGKNGYTWVSYCWDWVRTFDTIIIFGDCERDEITLVDGFSRRFQNKIKVVRREDYQDCKDANELLLKHGKEAVKKAVDNAEQLPIKRVKQLADIEAVDIYNLPKLKTGINQLAIRWTPLWWRGFNLGKAWRR